MLGSAPMRTRDEEQARGALFRAATQIGGAGGVRDVVKAARYVGQAQAYIEGMPDRVAAKALARQADRLYADVLGFAEAALASSRVARNSRRASRRKGSRR